jgi:hypothetical protein
MRPGRNPDRGVCGGTDWRDLIVVAVNEQGRHGELSQVVCLIGLREPSDAALQCGPEAEGGRQHPHHARRFERGGNVTIRLPTRGYHFRDEFVTLRLHQQQSRCRKETAYGQKQNARSRSFGAQ